MCLIVKCQQDIPLNQPLVEHWLEKNGDGWGMMYIKDNTMQVMKSMKPEELWDKYLELKQYDPVIHMRWRTHGDTDLDNCHPYYCGHGIFLMHNGVIGDASNRFKEKSDTWHFVEDVIKGIFEFTKNPHEAMRTQAFKKMLDKVIGTTNRIILGDRGGYVIFNESQWHTITNKATGCEGLLVSNGYAWDSYSYGKPKPQTNYGYRNSYNEDEAWESFRTGHSSSYTGSQYAPKEPVAHIDGTFRNALGQPMTKVIANLYVSPSQEVWAFIDGRFQRMEKLDKSIRNKLKKEAKRQAKLVPPQPEQTSLILLPKPDESPIPPAAPNPVVAANDDTDEKAERIIILNQQEYNDILVKSWRQESKAAIHSLVYAEPEDAATVLCSLLGKQ